MLLFVFIYCCCSVGGKGYTLGVPLPYQPSSVRSLSPVAAMVMRVLMHTVLLWTSCNKDNNVCILQCTYMWYSHAHCLQNALYYQDIRRSIQHLNDSEEFDVPNFFYSHLREDLQALGQFLSMNNDDVILLMHLVAKSILDNSPATIMDGFDKLLTEDDRKAWEEKFNKRYILPVIQVRIYIVFQECIIHSCYEIVFI